MRNNQYKAEKCAEKAARFSGGRKRAAFLWGMDGLLPGSGSVVVAVGVGSEAVGVGFAFACQPYDQQNLAYQGYYAGCAE